MKTTGAKKPHGVIYKITDTTNGLIYIGQTSDFKERIRHYRHESKKKSKIKFLHTITKRMRKEGFDKFVFEVIHECKNDEELDMYEIHFISLFDSTNPKIGYNIYAGARCKKRHKTTCSFRHTDEEKLKRSKGLIEYTGSGFILHNGAKNVADILQCDRSIVCATVKRGGTLHGSRFYYQDSKSRNELLDKYSSKKNKMTYIKIGNFINSVDVETIESQIYIIIDK